MPGRANLRVGLPGRIDVHYSGLLLKRFKSNEFGAV